MLLSHLSKKRVKKNVMYVHHLLPYRTRSAFSDARAISKKETKLIRVPPASGTRERSLIPKFLKAVRA